MADNPPQPSILWSVLLRILFVVFILVVVSPESFSNLNIGDGTIRIRVDLNVTRDRQHGSRQGARRMSTHPASPLPTTPQDNQPSSPQSPSGPAYTWARQYNSAPLTTTFAVQQPYTWRSTSGYVPAHANIYNTMPPHLPAVSEPAPRPLFPQYGAYTSMDPSPPFRASPIPPPPAGRLVRTNSNVDWAADDRLPPARPDGTTTPTPPSRRRSTAESMPGLVPIVNDESDDEILPVYDRPPEYDDERHSQPSSR
ncbi:hypothetical protein KCU65_g867, partial [Aureobasidium melanogenum]